MKKILLLTLALSVCASAQIDTNSQHFYMYSYFYNKQQEAGARLAFSSDGVHWVLYNNEIPIIVPVIAKGETPLMRDPNILFDPNTGVFHLTWTTAWNQDNIGYATSKDLKTWSEQIMIPVGQRIRGASCCWAPEFFYDDQKDSVMVFWSTERGTVGKEAFRSMTKDFKHYTAPRVYFSPKNANGEAYSVIDETILKVADNKYYLFYKDERTNNVAGKLSKNIHFVFGPTPQGPWWVGPWDDGSNPISGVGTEGPSAIIIGDEVRVFFDPYNTPENTNRSVKSMKTNFLGTEPAAISSFTPGEAMVTETGNFLPGHGSISEIPRAKVMQILYGIPDPTVYPQSWTHPAQSEIFVEEMPVEVMQGTKFPPVKTGTFSGRIAGSDMLVLDLGETSNFSVFISDITGKVISRVRNNSNLSAGQHYIKLNTPSSGKFLCCIRTPKGEMALPLTIIH